MTTSHLVSFTAPLERRDFLASSGRSVVCAGLHIIRMLTTPHILHPSYLEPDLKKESDDGGVVVVLKVLRVLKVLGVRETALVLGFWTVRCAVMG